MQEPIMDNVRNLINRYDKELIEKGIRCSVSKRYFETDVQARQTTSLSNTAIFHAIDVCLDERREKKYYKHQRNQYHCVILCFSPLETGLVEKTACRDYAFLLRKVERPHTGVVPEKQTYQEEKVLRQIEKRIQKVLRKAETQSVEVICKDTWRDAVFRYILSDKYAYKQTILHKEQSTWELISLVITVLIAVIIFLGTWILTNLLR